MRAGDVAAMPGDIRHQGYSPKRSMLLVWENASPELPELIAAGQAPRRCRSSSEWRAGRDHVAARGSGRPRPRRRHRRHGGLHPPHPARRRPRAHPPGPARPDARADDARRRLRPADRRRLRRRSSSSRGAATPASARSTASATPSSTAGRSRSPSRSTATPAWRPGTWPGHRACRSACCGATSAPTSSSTRATIAPIDVPVHRRGADGGAGAAARRRRSSTPSRPTGTATCSCGASSACRRRRCWRRTALDRDGGGDRRRAGARGPNAVVLPSWVIDAVCEVPGGAHPSFAMGYSRARQRLLPGVGRHRRSRERFPDWIDANVLATADFAEYRRQVGLDLPCPIARLLPPDQSGNLMAHRQEEPDGR